MKIFEKHRDFQRYYNFSDKQVEFQINDRISFMRFSDLTIADDIPDVKSIRGRMLSEIT
jgi:IS5 family transposase